MRRPWWLVIVLGALVAAAPTGHSDVDEMEHNRRLLEKWRADPEHSRRLQADLRAFYALPPERQDHLRQIDRQLHELDVTTQTRLLGVLDRYSVWLEHLPEAQRQQVLSATTSAERIERIRQIREQEWINRLPTTMRDDVMKLPPKQRADRVAKLRQDERAQKLYWLRTPLRGPGRAKDLRPTTLSEFPSSVRTFVADHLTPHLTSGEREQMRKADGKWPDLARTIHELSVKHPVLPAGPWGEVTTPTHLQKRLSGESWRFLAGEKQHRLAALARFSNNKWPEYALAAAEMLKRAGKKSAPLGASKLDELPKAAKEYVRTELIPVLSGSQKEKLAKAEGHWPEYPKQLLELAWLKRKVIPGMSLPGAHELWTSAARAALPDVQGRMLCEFAMNERTPEESAPLPGERSTGRRRIVGIAQRQRRCARRGRALAGADVLGAAAFVFACGEPVQVARFTHAGEKELFEERHTPAATGAGAAALGELAGDARLLDADEVDELTPCDVEA